VDLGNSEDKIPPLGEDECPEFMRD